ncbi:hypothetical protein A2U01_0097268, partial [Trifolium medium]|nr:hypothetical protein [Trifolium medium]
REWIQCYVMEMVLLKFQDFQPLGYLEFQQLECF